MKTKKKIALAISLIIIAVITVRGVLFFTAEPKVTVDYLSQLNKISQPRNYDPKNNASEKYQEAFDSFVRMPKELRMHVIWPADFDDANQNTLKEWLKSNEEAFAYFRNASIKPYYWLERNANEDSSMMSIMFPELSYMRDLADAVIWDAKLNAVNGLFQSTFKDILVCYRAGQHKCRPPSFIMEQMLGLGIKQKALVAGFEILNRVRVNSADLQAFQRALENEILEDKYAPDFEVEKLLCYDELQRSFVDNGKGTGRLAWKKLRNFIALCGEEYNRKVLLSCFIGPTKNEMAKRIEETFALFEYAESKTPWQVHLQDPNYFNKIDSLYCDDFFFGQFINNLSQIFQSYYQTKVKEQAFLATVAVFRFRADNNRFPDTLDELVSAEYLRYLPLDPYSNSALVYRPKGDSFTLYSVGENFEDDGGKEPDKTNSNPSGDIVFWPVKKSGQRMTRLEKHLGESKDVNTPAIGR